MNEDPGFRQAVERIYKVLIREINVDTKATIDSDQYIRIWVAEDIRMKVELVNDVAVHCGPLIFCNDIPLDNPANILANKLGAMLSRDEAKDVFDIVSIAENYSFEWPEIYEMATRKQIMNEEDVLMRLNTFPAEWLPRQKWLKSPPDLNLFQQNLRRVADDFLLARDNSLGKGRIRIEDARPEKF